MSLKKSAEKITYLYTTYRTWNKIPECCIKELETLCSYKCMSCKNSFVNKGWCPTAANTNCLYYEKKVVVKKDIVARRILIDDSKYIDERYFRAKSIYKEKGFVTMSLLQRHMKINSGYARSLLDKLKSELGDNIVKRI